MMESRDLIKNKIEACAIETETALASCVSAADADLKKIADAQTYSLLGGGKRIRPFLVLAFCEMLGGAKEKAMPLACALEMIHTYSLIHDDLPCMDDDDYRRGRLTNHRVFGEATAVLAGDALLTGAFGVVAEAKALSAEEKVAALALLSAAAGAEGMIGGQTMDMAAQTDDISTDEAYLVKMHGMKTGALIRAAAKLGCIAAGRGCDETVLAAADAYAARIGLAFQVVDDLLDVTGDAQTLGKNVGVDSAANKLTFLRFYTVEGAEAYAARLTEEAVSAITAYDADGTLAALARYLLDRKH